MTRHPHRKESKRAGSSRKRSCVKRKWNLRQSLQVVTKTTP